MPLALAGLQIHCDHAFAVQTIAGPVPSVIVACRQFHWQVNHSKFFIDAYLAPDAGVPRVGSGVTFPGVGSKLVRQRNRMENPKPLACPHIETTDISFYVGFALRD